MTTEPTPTTPQAGTPVSTPPQAGTNTPDPQAGDGQETISLEEAKKLRKEAQALRTRLSGYETAEKAAQEAALSEVEKANKARADAEVRIQQYQKQLVNAQVRLAAQGKGIINPDIAASAIADKLDYGDDGMPTNTEKALDELIKANPYLVAQQQGTTPTLQTSTTPAIPAMNPGRTSLPQPGTLTPGKRYKVSDVLK